MAGTVTPFSSMGNTESSSRPVVGDAREQYPLSCVSLFVGGAGIMGGAESIVSFGVTDASVGC